MRVYSSASSLSCSFRSTHDCQLRPPTVHLVVQVLQNRLFGVSNLHLLGRLPLNLPQKTNVDVRALRKPLQGGILVMIVPLLPVSPTGNRNSDEVVLISIEGGEHHSGHSAAGSLGVIVKGTGEARQRICIPSRRPRSSRSPSCRTRRARFACHSRSCRNCRRSASPRPRSRTS